MVLFNSTNNFGLLFHRLFDRILDEAAEYQMLAMPSRVKNLALGEVFNKLLDLHFECVPCNSATTSENHGSSHGSLQGSQHTDEAINEVRNIINVRGRGRMRGRGRRGRGQWKLKCDEAHYAIGLVAT